MSLEDASAQARARDFDRALATLLTRWQAAPHPQIADAIDAVSAQVNSTRPLLEAGTGTLQQAWLARAMAQDPRDLELLLGSLTTVLSRLAYARLEALQLWPDDPRLLRALHAHVRRCPWRRRSSAEPFGRLAVQTLAGSQSVESHAEVRALAALDCGEDSPFASTVGAALRAAAEALPMLPREDLSAEEQADCAAIIAATKAPTVRGAKTIAMLFDEAYTNPDDRDTRAVLADALIAQGDARGAFIAMQMARDPDAPPSAAETHLLEQHERDWLGPLGPMLAQSPQGWRDGFLHRARLARVFETIDPDFAGWATVRTLDVSPVEFSPQPGIADLLKSPRCVRLDTIIGLRVHDLEALLASVRRVPWSRLGIRRGYDLISQLNRLNAPNLRHLDHMDGWHHPNAAWVAAVVAEVPSLRRLDINLWNRPWARVVAFPEGLEEMCLYLRDSFGGRQGWSARFIRGSGIIEMEYRRGQGKGDPVEELRVLLARQGRLPFEHLRCLPSAVLADLDWAPAARQANDAGLGFTPP